MSGPALRLHHVLPLSRANGPGARAVVWLQGCTLSCPGCYNPATHPFADGEWVDADALFERLAALAGEVEGVTFSGGEPLQQRPGLLHLLRRVRAETALSVLVFTGYGWDEVTRFSEAEALLACIDVLIAGRYEVGQHLARDLRGSANKSVHFLTGRYTTDDLGDVAAAEVHITAAGEVLLSGIDPLRW